MPREDVRRLRLLIADESRRYRSGLRLLLGSVSSVRIVGEVGNGRDAVTIACAERVDVVLMDMRMRGLSGADATRQIHQDPMGKSVAVVILTDLDDEARVVSAFDAGAAGYLLKRHDSDRIVDAIHAVSRGEAMVSPRVAATVLREFVRRGATPAASDAVGTLTVAERRVVTALSNGATKSEEIAEVLNLSIHTVRSQLQSVLTKTGLSDRAKLALWGVRNRLDRDSLDSSG